MCWLSSFRPSTELTHSPTVALRSGGQGRRRCAFGWHERWQQDASEDGLGWPWPREERAGHHSPDRRCRDDGWSSVTRACLRAADCPRWPPVSQRTCHRIVQVKTGVGATGNAPPINPNDSYRVKVQKTVSSGHDGAHWWALRITPPLAVYLGCLLSLRDATGHPAAVQLHLQTKTTAGVACATKPPSRCNVQLTLPP